MDEKTLESFALANLPSQICPITKRPIVDAAVMHRDLSDWFPTTIADIRDDRLSNIVIVEREEREKYYAKLKQLGIVISFSGGLDSTTLLHWALRVFGKVHCVTFYYNQRHQIEVNYAEKYVAYAKNVFGHDRLSHQIVKMDVINDLAVSSLTRDKLQVPKNRSVDEMGGGQTSTFVPGRNLYFMTAVAQVAYSLGHRHIGLGVNVLDYSGYPDCRPEFIVAMNEAINIGIFNGMAVGVQAPLMYLTKKSIIRLGIELNVDYSKTHSCYNGVPGGCGECDSCILRRNAFGELLMEDPAIGAAND